MKLRFRVWMPLVTVLTVLLSIASMFAYGVPAARARLDDYARNRALLRAATTANALSGEARAEWHETLSLSVANGQREALVVDENGDVSARAGDELLEPVPEEVIRKAADGGRMIDSVGDLNVAVVPLGYEGSLFGGVVFISGEKSPVYQIFLRAGVEAAAIASIVGGGLMLLLATLLSRRVERLARGSRSIEEGDLSYRIKPGYDDELGKLAGAFNAMASRLEGSFDRIRESNDTLGAILENLTEGVMATDLGGHVIFSNPTARNVLGLEGEQKKAPSPWKDFDLPAAIARCATSGEGEEARVRSGDTFLRVKLEHMSHFDDYKGGVLVIMQDLSEGRRLEANQQRFLANAAHELKTPITAVLGASELLLSGDEDDPELRHRFLDHIHTEARRMQRLSETLLRLARTGQNRAAPDLRTLDLAEEARKAVEHIEPLAESAGLEVVFEGRGTSVRADPERLEQALLVPLGNAVQHSQKGQSIRLRVDGSTVTVEDEGSGISEENLPHVFERFYRGRRSEGGFGLGLSICKELVEGMGGEVAIRSSEGAGTTVEITLVEV